jgi:serine/threonine protein phosphatase 1
LPMERIFAVGDIHGCLDKLISLMDRIDMNPEKDTLVFIGDYIDRGSESKGVIDYLVELSNRHDRIVFLKGNHEQMFDFYLNGTDKLWFLANGGQVTLDSYLREDLPAGADLVPKSHLDFLGNLRPYYETNAYIFVHAGLKAKIPLAKQDEWDMLWMRDDFVFSDFDFGKRVIFGHTPFPEPLVRKNKIGIDTGAVYGNKLTCVELPAVKFYSV